MHTDRTKQNRYQGMNITGNLRNKPPHFTILHPYPNIESPNMALGSPGTTLKRSALPPSAVEQTSDDQINTALSGPVYGGLWWGGSIPSLVEFHMDIKSQFRKFHIGKVYIIQIFHIVQ